MKPKFLKSPIISKPPVKAGELDVYTLFYRIWDVDSTGAYINPREEILGEYVITDGKDYHETMTVYDPKSDLIVYKFKKLES